MKKFMIIFLAGVVVGTGGYWTFRDGPLATKVRENALVQKVGEKIDERASNRMKEEMERQGRIVVKKPAESTIDKLDDGRLTDLVKAKIAAEPLLSDSSIKTEANNGEVTLRGTANSYEQVGRAIRLAFECDATRTVVSTIEVKAPSK